MAPRVLTYQPPADLAVEVLVVDPVVLLRISAKELVYTLFYSKIHYYAYANPTAAAN